MKKRKLSAIEEEMSKIFFYDRDEKLYYFKMDDDNFFVFQSIHQMKEYFILAMQFLDALTEQGSVNVNAALNTVLEAASVNAALGTALEDAWANDPECQQCAGHPSRWKDDLPPCSGGCGKNKGAANHDIHSTQAVAR